MGLIESSYMPTFGMSSAAVTDVASKEKALKERRAELALADKQIESLMQRWAPDEATPSCFSRVRLCPTWFSSKRNRATAVSTNEIALDATNGASSVAIVRQSGEGNKLLNRLVGSKKSKSSEAQKIQSAIDTVQARVESLSDRVKLQRERAVLANQKGKREEALRELKKAKAVEKQLSAAKLALDTLERQQDMLAESSLQHELATALKSTTAKVKAKNKGLLSLAERAVDDSAEAKDEVEDIAAVFEGIAPSYDFDDDELLTELDALAADGRPAESGAAATTSAGARAPARAPANAAASAAESTIATTEKTEKTETSVVPSSSSGIEHFPSAPNTASTNIKREQHTALLSEH